jgi:hypothetical protein
MFVTGDKKVELDMPEEELMYVSHSKAVIEHITGIQSSDISAEL